MVSSETVISQLPASVSGQALFRELPEPGCQRNRPCLGGASWRDCPPRPCRIEKKRTVIPALAEAVGARAGRQVAWEYFYSLLFTCENLKLVHIACHKKTTHRLSCDPRRMYRPQAKPTRRRAARKRS